METIKEEGIKAATGLVKNGFQHEVLAAEFQQKISDVPQHIFEILYSTTDTANAINSILGLLGSANQVSRVYIFEDTANHKFCCNTFEWCAQGIQPEIENLSKVSYEKDLGGCYLNNFDADGMFFCPDVSALPELQYNILKKQGIVAMLQSAIIENGEFKGYIGFDECTRTMEWTQQQRQCLLLASKIISTFLCKMRREEALQKSNVMLKKSLAQLKKEHRKLQESEQRFQMIMENTSVSVWDYDVQNKRIIQTASSQKAHGFDKIVENVPESLIECGFVHPDSVEDLRDIYIKLSAGERHVQGLVRVQTADRKGWWYEKVQYSNLLDEKGKPYKAIAISSDVSEQKVNEEKLRRIIDSVPGGIGIFEVINNTVQLRYLNDGFYRLLRNTRESRAQYNAFDFWNAIHPEDLEHVRTCVKSLIAGESTLDFRYRVVNMNGEYTWLRVVGNKRVKLDGQTIIYCSFVKIDAYMEALFELQKKQAIIDISMENSKTSTWEFDIKRHCAILTKGAQIQHGLEKYVENLPESMIENGYVHPESADNYRKLFSGEFPDRKPLQYDIQVKKPGGDGYWWERYILAPIYNDKGELVTAFGTSVDISEQKKMLEFYQQQVYDLEHLSGAGLIAKGRYNLSRDQVEYFHRETDNAIIFEGTGSYDIGLRKTADRLVEKSAQRKFLDLFNRQKLIEEFDTEHSEVSMEYKRRDVNGKTLWCITQGKLYSDPVTGDIMCFICVYDITERKLTQEMMNAVVSLYYDYMIVLDCRTGDYISCANETTEGSAIPPFHTSDYATEFREFAEKHVVPEEVQRNIHDMSVGNILSQLKKADRFSCYANIKAAGGGVRRKMLQFSYLDRAAERVLITCADITDTYLLEQKQIKELQAAKDAAEEANRIKTQFFSRMSHDLRTPLNAVIGLTELAKDELADQKAMGEYISSIHSSGQFLLSLVNDGLDLEKMDANKLLLNPKPYTYEEFRNTIYTIIAPLCNAKRIEFFFGGNVTPYTVLMDHVRFEQIFINLLSNAVKFTPVGGKVELLIKNNCYKDSVLSCDFIVRDSGIGMSKAFQERMFEPFSQEGGQEALQGTGLGLSIVKSLVELMCGTISVKSEQGQGTEFTVHLNMPVMEVIDQLPLQNHLGEEGSVLSEKHILLVEDHPLNTQIAKKLLEKRKMRVTCADNGKKGLELFAASEKGEFDAILMDINMPMMDGLQAARAIRALDRQDAKTVPIIAMTANAFERDVRDALAAGMNAHLAKPIEPQELYKVLSSQIL